MAHTGEIIFKQGQKLALDMATGGLRSSINGLDEKISRLETAKRNLENHKSDFDTSASDVTGTELPDSWAGTRKDKANTYSDELHEALRQVGNKMATAIFDVKDKLRDLNEELEAKQKEVTAKEKASARLEKEIKDLEKDRD